MAKYKRTVVGSVCKQKEDPSKFYLKIRDDVKFLKGTMLSLESKKQQLESLKSAVAAGKLSDDVAEKVEERINKIPEWVMFEVVQVNKE